MAGPLAPHEGLGHLQQAVINERKQLPQSFIPAAMPIRQELGDRQAFSIRVAGGHVSIPLKRQDHIVAGGERFSFLVSGFSFGRKAARFYVTKLNGSYLRRRAIQTMAAARKGIVAGSGTEETSFTVTLKLPVLSKLAPSASAEARNKRVAPEGATKSCTAPVPVPVSPSPIKKTWLSRGERLVKLLLPVKSSVAGAPGPVGTVLFRKTPISALAPYRHHCWRLCP